MERDADAVRVMVAWRELRRVAATGALRHRFLNTTVGVLELAQSDALVLLAESGGCRMSDLADALRVDASTATRAVQRLVEAGLATREADPCDRRGVVVRPTEQGLAIRAELSELGRTGVGELLAGFDDRELGDFADLLGRFVAAIDAMEATVTGTTT
jgi:MarR family transcriptional regulator for hemolysin